jgi:hypothetical protein
MKKTLLIGAMALLPAFAKAQSGGDYSLKPKGPQETKVDSIVTAHDAFLKENMKGIDDHIKYYAFMQSIADERAQFRTALEKERAILQAKTDPAKGLTGDTPAPSNGFEGMKSKLDGDPVLLKIDARLESEKRTDLWLDTYKFYMAQPRTPTSQPK